MYFYDVYFSPSKELIGHYLCLNYITYVADTGCLMLPGEYKKTADSFKWSQYHD